MPQPNALPYINFNGNLIPEKDAPAPIQSSVFRFADGLFESMLVVDGVVQLAQLHYERLMKGMAQCNYEIPSCFTQNFFEAQTKITVRENEGKHQRVRFQVSMEAGKFAYLIETLPIEEDVFLFNKEGWKLGVINISLKDFEQSGNLKRINIPLYTQGADMAAQQGWNDVLLSKENYIVESGGANIFWVKNGIIYTPPLAHGCIEGTMRRHITASLSHRFSFLEEIFTQEKMLDADEIFLTNAIRRIKWVGQINHQTYPCRLAPTLYNLLF
ncbi:MAG TPA: aminotransferase class IV [Flavipsychrobacter sp.]|nr:aminotransferase class IV [Flavipsychrobacter sp.]